MQFSLATKTASLSVGEFSDFALGPRESGGGSAGIWRAQLGQHWHNELRAQTEREQTVGGALRPGVGFEIPIEGRLVHRGWTVALGGRIDQLVGSTLREIKTVTRPLPADEAELRADYGPYFLQLATYVVLARNTALIGGRRFVVAENDRGAIQAASADGGAQGSHGRPALRAELIFVEAASGLAQTLTLTAFDEALVHHQLDAVVEFLELQLRAAERRHRLQFRSPFPALRPGQETIHQDLATAFHGPPADERSKTQNPKSKIVFLEAPTGYGKTGCALEFALGELQAGRYDRLIWLTGKSTGQLQVIETLRRMTANIERPSNLIGYPTSEALVGNGNNQLGYSAAEPPTLDGGPSSREVARQSHLIGDKSGTLSSENGTAVGKTCHLLGDSLPEPLAFWQVRNKGEHCVNSEFHCVRDNCGYLAGAEERWPASGLARFYRDPSLPHDLDTLRAAGREARICPYEITRTALAFNDVWIGDYNYVFAPDNRGLFFEQPGFDATRTLLVIDEAHNLPSRVADAYSHTAHDGDVRALLAELDHQRAPTPLILAVESWARTLASVSPCEILDGALEADVREALGRLAELVMTQPLDYAALGPHHSETLWQVAKLHDFLDDTRLHRLLWSRREGELEFTCVDASAAIGESLDAFGGALLMSATLAPFDQFAASCGLGACGSELAPTNYSTLRAPAPWRHAAYDVAVDLRVATTLRERTTNYPTTAATIEQLFGAAGRAVVVFFPSYAYAEAIQRTLGHIGSVVRVSLQPKLPDLAAQAAWVEENLAFADALFLVLGSSFAESIDLLGGRVSHAMVVGPALPEVNAVQRARLDAFSGLGRDAAFRRVYQIPGLQKVNQALGRLVRGPGHRAKVLLHCKRFAEPSYAALLDPECQQYREIVTAADLEAWLASGQTS